ncbi:hypothetical protein EL75_4693 [Escherichia coli]|nr:hypothetical protein EL75_4693 [Escherichia coli]
MCHLWAPVINPVFRCCVTIPDKWNMHVDVKARHYCRLSLLL